MRKKGDRDLEREIKKTQETFFCWKDTFHVVVVQNNSKGMCKKKCAARAKLFFLLIRPIAVFHRSPALPSPLSDHILFEQTFNIIESFAFSPG